MKWICISVLLFSCNQYEAFLSQTPSSLASKAIFLGTSGHDNRTAMTSTEFPWSSIGRLMRRHLNGSSNAICTATLVGRHILLTAAHCVLENNQIQSITFQVGYNNDNMLATSKSNHISVGTYTPDNNQHDRDWAVVELEDALGDKYGWMGVHDTTQDKHYPILVEFVGYSDNFQAMKTASVQTDCQINDYFQDWTFGHNCSEGPGGSGGPLFAYLNGHYVIYGVNTRGNDGKIYPRYTPILSNISVMTSALVDKVIEYKNKYD